jgi:hypothetical protein
LGPQGPRQFVGDQVARRRGESDGGGHRCGDERGVGEGRQVDPDHAVGKGVVHLGGQGQGEPGLADASRAGQGQQRHGLVEQAGAGRGELRLATDEAGAGNREIAGRPIGGGDHASILVERMAETM